MQKLFLKLSLFIIPLIAILVFFEQKDNQLPILDASVARIPASIKVNPTDYLFVGPSYCYDGIYTPLFDSLKKSVFVLGVATAGPYFYETLLDDYLSCCKARPKFIFFNISLGTCSNVMDNWPAYPIHRYLNTPLTNEHVCIKYSNVNDYILLVRKSIKKSIQNIFLDSKCIKNDFNKLTDITVDNRGYSCSENIVDDSELELNKSSYLRFDQDGFNKKKSQYFVNLIRKYEKMGIRVVVFEIPTFKLIDVLSKQYIAEYNFLKKKIIAEKINLIEDKTGINDYYFFSSRDHMNINGAKIFTKKLIKEINRIENRSY